MRKTAFAISAMTAVLLVGCAHEQFVTDAQHPEIRIDEHGVITYREKIVAPEDLPGLLEDSGLTHKETIYIHIPTGLEDYRMSYHVIGQLVRNGYRRPVLVEDRKATSSVKPKAPPPAKVSPPVRRQIRYK